MDKFEVIDMEKWPRREIYKLYTEQWPTTTYSVTKHMPAEKLIVYLKERNIKLVPALIWLVSDAFNHCENYKLAVKDGKLGRWNVIHPMFPTLNSDKNMSFHSVRYVGDFEAFYEAYLQEQRENINKTCLWACEVPENFYMVSVFPFMHFDASSMQMRGRGYYAPFFAIGRYDEEKRLPCMIMGNHAVTDAWHVSEAFNEIQARMDAPSEWCKFSRR